MFLYTNPFDVQGNIHTKLVSRVVSSQWHIIPHHFFQQGHQLNDLGCSWVLKTYVDPWIDLTCMEDHNCFSRSVQLITNLKSLKNRLRLICTAISQQTFGHLTRHILINLNITCGVLCNGRLINVITIKLMSCKLSLYGECLISIFKI